MKILRSVVVIAALVRAVWVFADEPAAAVALNPAHNPGTASGDQNRPATPYVNGLMAGPVIGSRLKDGRDVPERFRDVTTEIKESTKEEEPAVVNEGW